MDDLIAMTLEGRLGNHLFIYSLGRVLNGDRPVPVDDLRKPSIWLAEALQPGTFRLINHRELAALRQPPRIPRGRRALGYGLDSLRADQPLRRMYRSRQYYERWPGEVDPEVFRLRGPVLLNGCFQSEGYFLDIADRLVSDFRPASPEAIQRTKGFVSRVGPGPTVAVVVRAGADYQDWGWSLDLDWYLLAVSSLCERIPSARFAVFSDIRLAAEAVAALLSKLGPAEPILGMSAVDQLHIIAAMDHAVIADSSFAWWGAWLGDHRTGFATDRIVLAPDPWILPEYKGIPSTRWASLPSKTDVATKFHPTYRR